MTVGRTGNCCTRGLVFISGESESPTGGPSAPMRPGALPDARPPALHAHAAYVLVSRNSDRESIIFLPLIFEAGDFCVHSEPILRFSIKLLSGKKKIHVTSVKFTVHPQRPLCSADSDFHAFREGHRRPRCKRPSEQGQRMTPLPSPRPQRRPAHTPRGPCLLEAAGSRASPGAPSLGLFSRSASISGNPDLQQELHPMSCDSRKHLRSAVLPPSRV